MSVEQRLGTAAIASAGIGLVAAALGITVDALLAGVLVYGLGMGAAIALFVWWVVATTEPHANAPDEGRS